MKKYNKKAAIHLLQSYAEFQNKLNNLAKTGMNPFEFSEKYDEQIRTTVVLIIKPDANYSEIEEISDAIYNHIENSLPGRINFKELLKYIELELFTSSEKIIKITENSRFILNN